MGAVRVKPTTKPSCSCMDRAGEAPSPSTLNSVMATRADITPPWAEGGATGVGARCGTTSGDGVAAGTPGWPGPVGTGAGGGGIGAMAGRDEAGSPGVFG